MNYIIFAPDYSTTSAGIRCLYLLADELNKRGLATFITGSSQTDPQLRAPLMPLTIARRVIASAPVTVIYPEIISGNPLGAKRVVRWVLNSPGLLGGDTVYASDELVFTYSEYYRPFIANKVAGKLHMPTLDRTLFHDEHSGERSLECFYVGKSTFKPGLFDPDRTFEITRNSPRRSELGKLFRHSKVLYCFDNSTALAFEAAMCGCPAVIIPDGTQTQENFARQELGMNGVAWGLEDLPRAVNSLVDLPAAYDSAKRDFNRQIDQFLSLTLLPKVPAVMIAEGRPPDLEYCAAIMQALVEQEKVRAVRGALNAGGSFDWRARFWKSMIFPLRSILNHLKVAED